MKKLAFLAFFPCLLIGCGLVTTYKIQNAYYEEYTTFSSVVDTIPIKIVKGNILLNISIDGVEKQFALDTGAGTCIDKTLSEHISYKKLGKRKVKGTNGKTKRISSLVIPEFNVKGVTFSNTIVSVYDFSHLSTAAGSSVDGILGANSMNKLAWQINYSDSSILISQNPNLFQQSPKADTVSFNAFGRGTPTLNLYRNNKLLSAVCIDTGSNGTIDLSSSIKPEKPTIRKHVLSASINTIQAKKVDITILDSISISNHFKLEPTEITFMDNLNYGLIGNRFLKDYKVTLDWLNQRLILDPIEREIQNSHHTNYGIFTYYQNSNVFISSIYENSVGYQQGLRLRDQILSINGESLIGIDDETYKEFVTKLKASNKPIIIEVKLSDSKTSLVLYKIYQLQELLNP